MKMRLHFMVAATVMSVAAAVSLRAQDGRQPFRDNEFITEWYVCGPFPMDENHNINTDFLAAAGGETNPFLEFRGKFPSISVADGEVGWKRVVGDSGGKLDFNPLFTSINSNIAYAATYIVCDRETPVMLKAGSDDRLKVWVNGLLVDQFLNTRGAIVDEDLMPVVFHKGENLVVAKVDNGGGAWDLYLRFEETMNSVDGTVYVSDPMSGIDARRPGPKRIRDSYDVLVYNYSPDSLRSPLRLSASCGTDKKDGQSVVVSSMAPYESRWVKVFNEADLSEDTEVVRTVITASTGKGQVSMPVEVPASWYGSTYYFLQGFHVDPVWRNSQAGYQPVCYSNMTQNLAALDADSLYQFFVHEIPYLKPYYDEHPEQRAKIRKNVRNGRIALGGSYNQPAEVTVSGETVVRNILYGRLFHENVLGDTARIYMPWDVFGHVVQMPQILDKAEFEGMVFERGEYRDPNVKVPGLSELYSGMAPDGTRMLTKNVSYTYRIRNTGDFKTQDEDLRRKSVAHLKEQMSQIPGIKSDFRVNAYDFKSPTAWLVGNLGQYKTTVPAIDFKSHGAEAYFNGIRSQMESGEITVPVASRDRSQYNEGCDLSRLDLKIGNRIAENTIVEAEKFASVANLMGAPYPAEKLDKAWRQVLYNSHHDGVTGCCSDVPYLGMVEGYMEAISLGQVALYDALENISSKVDTRAKGNAVPLVVFNSLNWIRTDIVQHSAEFEKGIRGFVIKDETGRLCPVVIDKANIKDGKIYEAEFSFVAADVPSVGYRTFWLEESKSTPPMFDEIISDTIRTIANERYAITVDESMGGGIVSLKDKSDGKEYIDLKNGYPGNEIILLKQGNGFEPAWRFITTGEKYFLKDRPCQIKVTKNPLYSMITVTNEMQNMKRCVREIRLYNDVERIDFDTWFVGYDGMDRHNLVENDPRPRQNDRDLFVVGFPVGLEGSVPVLDDKYATKAWITGKEPFNYVSSATMWTSMHSMNGAYQWFDHSSSVTLDFGSAGSVGVPPCEILTVRGSEEQALGATLMEALAKRGVPATPSFDDVERSYDIQYRRFCFSIGTPSSNKYSEKLLSRLTSDEYARFMQNVNADGYAFLFMHDENVDEAWFDYPVLIIMGKDSENTKNAVEHIVLALSRNPTVFLDEEVCMGEITHSVPDNGFAILNHGNLPVSSEPDGTMVLALMHTVPWQNPILKWTHDFPERKTHHFEYSIIPHKGTWRDASMVRRGYEYNNPLRAVTVTRHDGDLPPSHSFFSTGGDANVVVTAIKPKTAGKESFSARKPTDVSNGLIMRYYETDGGDGTVNVTSAFTIKSAKRVNLVERKPSIVPFDSHGIEMNIGANSIETIFMDLDRAVIKGKEESPSERYYMSYWQHDVGAAPAGGLGVGVKILDKVECFHEERPVIQQTRIAVINDFTDTTATGKVRIETPYGIRAVPEMFDFEVAPNSETIYTVTLLMSDIYTRKGFIRASIEYDGDEIFDVKEYDMLDKKFGLDMSVPVDEPRLTWDVSREGNSLNVTVSNPFNQRITGEVSMIGPMETWGMKDVNSVSYCEIAPARIAFDLDAGMSETYCFDIVSYGNIPSEYENFWIVAKLSYFGYTDYKAAVGNLDMID